MKKYIFPVLFGATLVLFIGYYIQTSDKLSFLYKMQGIIEQKEKLYLGELRDRELLTQQLVAQEYQKGYQRGKTDTIVTLVKGDSVGTYTEGYHAALEQFSEEINSTDEPDLSKPEVIPVSIRPRTKEDLDRLRAEIDEALSVRSTE